MRIYFALRSDTAASEAMRCGEDLKDIFVIGAMNMRNIKLTIRYDGTDYSGWQFQKNATSIQETMESALRKITGERTVLIASGRTDAGVHALAQVANFHTASKIPLKNLRMALNSILPDDMIITRAEGAAPAFNSQKHARSKLYRYTIYNKEFMDPFLKRYASKCFFKLDIRPMKESAKYLIGRRDFTSFRTKDDRVASAVRTIKRIKIIRIGDLIYIDVEADGFLYNMVRNIVGTLVDVGRGKLAPVDVKHILSKKDKRSCGPTASASGLSLVKVRY